MWDGNLVLFALLVVLVVGEFRRGRAESRHYRSLEARELEVCVPITTGDGLIGPPRRVKGARMVWGNVAIPPRWRLVAKNTHTYQASLDRARREAILRMKESCPEADQLIKLRLETVSDLHGGVEVIAYATAIVFEEDARGALSASPGGSRP